MSTKLNSTKTLVKLKNHFLQWFFYSIRRILSTVREVKILSVEFSYGLFKRKLPEGKEEKQEKKVAMFILEINRFTRNHGHHLQLPEGERRRKQAFPSCVARERILRSVSGLGVRGRQVSAQTEGFLIKEGILMKVGFSN